jgi:hypothetical protein
MKYKVLDLSRQVGFLELSSSEKIGEGATATVYKVEFENQNWAAKIYKPEKKNEIQKLEAMIASPPPNLSIVEGEVTFIQYTWTKYLLNDFKGNCCGYLMPYIDEESTNALDNYYDPVLVKRLSGVAQSALSFRIEIAMNLCDLIHNLHSLSHYFIDIKPQNIRVYRDTKKVVLMDCDGYSIKNPKGNPDRFPADLISTDFIAPEVTKKNLSPKALGEEQDKYGLAVILFQLLNRGTHPFQGISQSANILVSTNDQRAALGLYPYGLKKHLAVTPRTQSLHDLFLIETRELFDRAFTTFNRPSAKEWKDHFQNILDQKLLTRCGKKPNDVRHIHFRNQECIGCKIEIEKKRSTKTSTLPSKATSYPSSKPLTPSPSPPPQTQQVPAQSATQTQGTSYTVNSSANIYPSLQSKEETNWKIPTFIGIFAFLLLIFVTSPPGNKSSTNSTASTDSAQQGTCPALYNLNNDEICKLYYGNKFPLCTGNFNTELASRSAKSFPENACGKQMDKPPESLKKSETIENKLVDEPKTLREKFELIASKSSNNKITLSSLSDEKSKEYLSEINSFILSELNNSSAYIESGLRIFPNLSINFISSITFIGTTEENCKGQSLGRVESCIIENSTAKCQRIDGPTPKSVCLESITK